MRTTRRARPPSQQSRKSHKFEVVVFVKSRHHRAHSKDTFLSMLHLALLASAFFGPPIASPTSQRGGMPICQQGGRRDFVAGFMATLPVVISAPAFASKADQERVAAQMKTLAERSKAYAEADKIPRLPQNNQKPEAAARLAAQQLKFEQKNVILNRKVAAAPVAAPAAAPTPAPEPAAPAATPAESPEAPAAPAEPAASS